MSDSPADDIEKLARKTAMFFQNLCDGGMHEYNASELTKYYLATLMAEEERARQRDELPTEDGPSDPA